MNEKLCRICWNTNGWRKPSGAIPNNEKSFAGNLGFGMEEWLFNYEWLIEENREEYRYGYLTPISRRRSTYEGHRFSAALFTRYSGFTLLAAEITNIYVPRLDELQNAFNQMNERGWIDQMREDIRSVNGRLDDFENNLDNAEWSINIRFKPSDVTFHDPMRIIDVGRRYRYNVAYDWDGEPFPEIDDGPQAGNPDDPRRDERQRRRAAQRASTIDPRHVRLQNKLFSILRARHGNGAVRYEEDYVDLKVIVEDGCTFYEIKIDVTAKKCIRNALGQLLEYSSYPAEQRAQKLVVVGDAPATNDDGNYLRYLREQYSLPIYYARFNWEKKNLESET